MKIAVIGGGVMGLACSWRLARAGVSVSLFESRRCGEGATLASLGAPGPASPLSRGPLQQMHRESLWGFEGFANQIAQESGMAVDFRRLGRVTLLSKGESVERAVQEARAACDEWPRFGGSRPTMEVLESWEVAREYPGLGKQGQRAVRCRATAQVNVGQLVAGLRGACVAAGVTLHEGTAVTGLECEGGRAAALQTSAGRVPVDGILVTAGAWTPALSPALAEVAPIRPVKGQALRLRLPAGVRVGMIFKSGTTYLVPWDDEVLVGATTEPDAGMDESPTSAARDMLLKSAVAILPALADAEVIHHWAGLRPQNPAKGHAPIMGPHRKIPNVYLCTGHYKTGIGMAPLVSQWMTELIIPGHAPRLAPFFPA